MKIILLREEYSDKLIDQIMQHLDEGWEMQGGICVAQKEESRGSIGMYFKVQETYYYQTMIKKGE